jgi:hypothetical protein
VEYQVGGASDLVEHRKRERREETFRSERGVRVAGDCILIKPAKRWYVTYYHKVPYPNRFLASPNRLPLTALRPYPYTVTSAYSLTPRFAPR